MTDQPLSSGVQDLIQRLREEGAAQGQQQSLEIVDDARARAQELLDQAHREAEAIIQRAKVEAASTRAAGHEAIQLAFRDAVLRLKQEIADHFAARVRRLVSQTLRNNEFLQRLVLQVASEAVPAEVGQHQEILLPADLLGIEDLRRHPEEAKEGTLAHYVLSLASETLREGVTFAAFSGGTPGIRVRLKNDDVEIDLTDKAVADLLLQHLLPRFRAVLEGVVQ